jgi:hypothetical protein
MADKKISIVKALRDEANAFEFTSLAASDKVIIDWECKDECTMLIFLGGSGASTVTMKAGNGIQGVNDIVIEVPASAYVAVPINSGRVKNTYGEDVGNVVLSVSAACSLAVVEGR